MKNLVKAGRRVSPSRSYTKHSLIPIGAKFGRWEVIENDLLQTYGKLQTSFRACRVRCSCSAGTIATVTSYHLRNGHSRSCGCLKSETGKLHKRIPIGTKFGHWEVIENDLSKKYKSQTGPTRACRVRCICGKEQIITYCLLRAGKTQSCGCKANQRSIERVWRTIFDIHTRRRWDFHLTLPELKIITQFPCAYCGKEPSNIQRCPYVDKDGVRRRGIDPSLEIRYSGIDRVDSMKPYEHGNVVPCCRECNLMKNNFPLDDFLAFVERIRAHGSSAAGIRSQAATLFESLS